MLVYQGYVEDAESVAVRLQKRLKEERRLKTEAESMVAHFENSAREANEHLEQAIKLFEAEKVVLTKRAEKAEKNLGPMKEKYATLVKQINDMLTAIFGTCSDPPLSMCRFMNLVATYFPFSYVQGEKTTTL